MAKKKTGDRKFYRTVVEIEVLSDEPMKFAAMSEVFTAVREGDCSGAWKVTAREVVDGQRMAKLLKAQDNTPDFFNLTDAGHDITRQP